MKNIKSKILEAKIRLKRELSEDIFLLGWANEKDVEQMVGQNMYNNSHKDRLMATEWYYMNALGFRIFDTIETGRVRCLSHIVQQLHTKIQSDMIELFMTDWKIMYERENVK